MLAERAAGRRESSAFAAGARAPAISLRSTRPRRRVDAASLRVMPNPPDDRPLQLSIDGAPHVARPGASVLEAMNDAGVHVPQLCHDPRVAARGVCRLCLVHVDGEERPVSACTLPVREGLSVRVRTPELEAMRHTVLEEFAWRYPADAVARAPEKPLHQAFREYGVLGELRGERDPSLVDDSHPYLHVDLNQCIQCFRCVSICDELQGQFVWRVLNRGARTRVAPDGGKSLRESSCVSCGACADSCPTGAIEDRSLLAGELPETWTRTTCPYCGVGCELDVGARDGRIVDIKPDARRPGQQGPPLREGPLRLRLPARGRPRDHAAASRRQPLARSELGRGHRPGGGAAREAQGRARTGQPRHARLGARDQRGELRGAEVRARGAGDQQRGLLRARLPLAQRRRAQGHARHRRGHQLLRRYRARPRLPRLRRERDREPPGGRRAHQAGGAARRPAGRHRPAADRARRPRRGATSSRGRAPTCRSSTPWRTRCSARAWSIARSSRRASTAWTRCGASSRPGRRSARRSSAAWTPRPSAGPRACTPRTRRRCRSTGWGSPSTCRAPSR